MVRAWIEAQRKNVAQSKKTLIHRHLFEVDAYNYGKKNSVWQKNPIVKLYLTIWLSMCKWLNMLETFTQMWIKFHAFALERKQNNSWEGRKKKSINKTMKYDELLRRRRPRQWYLSAIWLKWNRIDFINKRRKCGFNVLFYILLWNLHMFFWLRDFA